MADRLKAALTHAAKTVASAVERPLKSYGGGPVPEAMAYAMAGGKTLRGFLVLEGARLYDVEESTAAPVAAAIEAIHAYSLVHDDLPCMDDDDLRRGRPTVHRKWDEATAVLAGDALQSMAFELICSADLPDIAKVALVRSLSVDAGMTGMVGGQADDIAAETAKTPLPLDEITSLQARKTGALINRAATAGPTMVGADVSLMRRYGNALGLAFQIADDILDVEGDAAKAGKRLQKDADAGKATFVSLLGLEGAKARARELVDDAQAALAPHGERAETLREAARFVISREF